VTACAVTPDGRRVVSASEDGTLKVWDLASGRAEATLKGHASGVNSCSVTPDGRRVVSASEDGTLQVWDLTSGRAEATLEGHASGVNSCSVTRTGGGRSRRRRTERSRCGTWRADTQKRPRKATPPG